VSTSRRANYEHTEAKLVLCTELPY